MLNKNKTGLIVGFFLAIIHAVWAFAIAIIPNQLQNFLDWIFEVHFLEPYWIITAFNIMGAIFLVIITFVFGYIFGFLFALIWNYILKFGKKKTRKKRRR